MKLERLASLVELLSDTKFEETFYRAILSSRRVQNEIKVIRDIKIGGPTEWKLYEDFSISAFWNANGRYKINLHVFSSKLASSKYDARFPNNNRIVCRALRLGVPYD